MDPEAVLEEARGDVDESLLTGTRGGFLGRDILADEPLVAHLRDDETLHYLLSGPGTPTRASDGESEHVEARGSYLTLVAVTDDRILLVVGSDDGDRRFSFPHGDLVGVGLESGFVTETVVVETGPDVTWRIEVGRGSDAEEAVAYAHERLSRPDAARSPEAELVDAVFRTLVGDADEPLRVEQYGPDDVDALVADLGAHRDRLRTHLGDGDPGAARGAATTVEALGHRAERLAEANGDRRLARRIEATRREARRAVVADALDVADGAAFGGASTLDGAAASGGESEIDDGIERALARLLRVVDLDAFVELVADVWSALGYQTTLTSSDGDGGSAVVGRRTSPAEQTVIVHANHRAPDGTVGRGAIQQFARRHEQEPDVDAVVVVTAGTFTEAAVETATDLDVRLVDGDQFVELVAERDLHDVVARHAVADRSDG